MTLNTISKPHPPKSPNVTLPRSLRPMAIAVGFVSCAVVNATFFAGALYYYTKDTKFVPYDTADPDLQTPLARAHNPGSNPPVCIDHAVRTVRLDKLNTRDKKELTRGFCAGIWGGAGFAIQRRMLEKNWRGKEGRENMLWDWKELREDSYQVGTVVADHFEVVERTDDKVVVRCGDSPLNAGPRPSDGLFTMEVTEDPKTETATFHLKSVFVDTTPEGKASQPLGWSFQFLHRVYTKIMMETSVRSLMKKKKLEEQEEVKKE